MKLNKNHVYSLEDLTSEEKIELGNNIFLPENIENVFKFPYVRYGKEFKTWLATECDTPTHNAKELFYTLENVQVDCRDLSEEQIKEMADVFEKAGYNYFEENKDYALEITGNNSYLHIYEGGIIIDSMVHRLNEITYNKFMELFAERVPDVKETLQPHYDNTNGSIYKFCNDQKLNAWEFDIIKRVVRCRKKGLFKEDLQKTKDLIDLYLKEFTDEN